MKAGAPAPAENDHEASIHGMRPLKTSASEIGKQSSLLD
jgi:hypothetical protein